MAFIALTLIVPPLGERAINTRKIQHIGAPSEDDLSSSPDAQTEVVTDFGTLLVKESLREVRFGLQSTGEPFLMELAALLRKSEEAAARAAAEASLRAAEAKSEGAS